MNPLEIMNQLKLAKSSKKREEIIEQAWLSKSEDFFLGAQLALSPFFSYPLTVPKITEEDNEPDILDPKIFFEKITLKTKDAIDELLNETSVNMWNNWYRKILTKDLFKLTNKEVNKVLNRMSKTDVRAMKFLIPEIKFQECQDFNNSILIGIVYLDPYIKGDRILISLDKENDSVMIFTTQGKEYKKLLDKQAQFKNLLSHLPISVVLDGVATNNITYIFDILPLDEYKKGFSKRAQDQRHAALCELDDVLQDNFQMKIQILPKRKIDMGNKELFNNMLLEYKNEGYQFIVVKNTALPYMTRKSNNWLKINT